MPTPSKSTREFFDPFHNKVVQINDELTDRLRGKYAVGPTLQNGEPEFGYRWYPQVPIQLEAADEIERLRNLIMLLQSDIKGA